MTVARDQPRREATWNDRALTIKIGKALARYPHPIIGEAAVLADIAAYRYGIEDMTGRVIEFRNTPSVWTTSMLRPP